MWLWWLICEFCHSFWLGKLFSCLNEKGYCLVCLCIWVSVLVHMSAPITLIKGIPELVKALRRGTPEPARKASCAAVCPSCSLDGCYTSVTFITRPCTLTYLPSLLLNHPLPSRFRCVLLPKKHDESFSTCMFVSVQLKPPWSPFTTTHTCTVT